MDIVRFDVYYDGASKGKIVQNVSKTKIFQEAVIYFPKHLNIIYSKS